MVIQQQQKSGTLPFVLMKNSGRGFFGAFCHFRELSKLFERGNQIPSKMRWSVLRKATVVTFNGI